MPTTAQLKFQSPTELDLLLMDGETAIAKVAMDAAEVARLIALLAAMREKMQPEIERRPPQGNLSGYRDPVFAVYDFSVLPGKYLVLRHPGLGWLSFLLPQAEAEAMAKGLLASGPAAAAQKPPPGRLQ